MAKAAETLRKILTGRSDAAISFSDLRRLLLRLGFAERVRGSHHIFTKEGVEAWREAMLAKPKTEPRYELIVYWSSKDRSFIVEVPELPGCAADGQTYREAVANAERIIREWVETAQELGRPIPQPKGRLMDA